MKKQGLGKVCNACGKTRKSTHLLYDPQTLLPYCVNPYVCNEDHPNSPVNLIRNQTETMLVDYATANEAHKTQLIKNFDSHKVDRIVTLTTKPLTIRLQDPDIAKFLIELEEDMGFTTTAETIRYCIAMMQENRGVYYSDHKRHRVEREIEETAQATVESFSKPQPVPTPTLTHKETDEEELSF